MDTPYYVIQTPRAGSWGHRFILPGGASRVAAENAQKYCSAAALALEGKDYLAVASKKIQDVGVGNTRIGQEMLILVGINTAALSPEDKRSIVERMEQRMASVDVLVSNGIDWQQAGRDSFVLRPELSEWIREDGLTKLPSRLLQMQTPSVVPEKKRKAALRGKFLLILVVCTLAGALYFKSDSFTCDSHSKVETDTDISPTTHSNGGDELARLCGFIDGKEFSEVLEQDFGTRLENVPSDMLKNLFVDEKVDPFAFMDRNEAEEFVRDLGYSTTQYMSTREAVEKKEFLWKWFVSYKAILESEEVLSRLRTLNAPVDEDAELIKSTLSKGPFFGRKESIFLGRCNDLRDWLEENYETYKDDTSEDHLKKFRVFVESSKGDDAEYGLKLECSEGQAPGGKPGDLIVDFWNRGNDLLSPEGLS